MGLFRRSVTCFQVFGGRCCSSLKEEPKFRGLIPFVDIDDRLSNEKQLLDELSRRENQICLQELIPLWKRYKQLATDLKVLETRRGEINIEVKKGNESAKAEGRELRGVAKTLAKEFVTVERTVIPAALALPVPLAAKQPLQYSTTKQSDSLSTTKRGSSLEVGRCLGIINWRDEWTYFLIGQGALYELAAPAWLSRRLKQTGLTLISGTDFALPALVNALPVLPPGAPMLSSRLHLLGPSSAATASAPLARSIIPTASLPLCFLSIGRSYFLPEENAEGLHRVVQRHCAHALLVGASNSEVDSLIETTWDAVSELGLEVELRYAEPAELMSWEAARVEILAVSPLNGHRTRLSSLSDLGDQAARRLRAYTQPPARKNLSFVHIHAGTLLDIPALLATILEYGDEAASHLIESHLALFNAKKSPNE